MKSSFLERNDSFFAHLEDGKEQLLRDHLRGVSLATRRNSNKIGLGQAGALIGLMHDLGKYSRAFCKWVAALGSGRDALFNGKRATMSV
jgi:CRISPR-associated endonuclease/helicase Cas3